MRNTRIATLALALTGCERVVSIDLPDATPQLVVDARIEHVQGSQGIRQRIQLSLTAPFSSDQPPPPARGAMVTVTDDAGHTTLFPESSTEPGVYATDALSERSAGSTRL